MRFLSLFSGFCALLVLGVGLASCGGGGGEAAIGGQLSVSLERNPLQTGEATALHVRLLDASNRPLPGEFEVMCQSLAIAQVEPAGDTYLVRAVSPGRTLITVRERRTGQQRQVEVIVAQPTRQVARVEILAERTTFFLRERPRFRAIAYDQNDQPIEAVIDWSSSNPAVMSILTSGVAEARSVGSVQITARVRDTNIRSSITVQVVQSLPGSGGLDVSIQ
ncbi:MAG: hypothetical protein NZM10_03685 [Fimbriimonadales bacterium]|nr:hypothetical protein [Fimbriimonadales bacterium]MCS7190700.1 hypothetical protein [Fimbriimonadales bacterium]